MLLTWFKVNNKGVFGVLKDDYGGTYMCLSHKDKYPKAGDYDVTMCNSQAFGCELPLIHSKTLPASRGFRFHGGNTMKNSDGCILLGNGFDLVSMALTYSQDAVRQFCGKFKSNETKKLTIIEVK